MIEDIEVVQSKESRRKCTLVEDYRRLKCVELAVNRDAVINAAQRESLDVKTVKQFTY